MERMSSVMYPFPPCPFYLYYLFFSFSFIFGFRDLCSLFVIVFFYIWYFEEAIVHPLPRGFFLFVLFDLHGSV